MVQERVRIVGCTLLFNFLIKADLTGTFVMRANWEAESAQLVSDVPNKHVS